MLGAISRISSFFSAFFSSYGAEMVKNTSGHPAMTAEQVRAGLPRAGIAKKSQDYSKSIHT